MKKKEYKGKRQNIPSNVKSIGFNMLFNVTKRLTFPYTKIITNIICLQEGPIKIHVVHGHSLITKNIVW